MAGTTKSSTGRLLRIVAVALACTALSAGPAGARDRSFGDARIVSQVPVPPGFPEGIVVRGNIVYVAGPATVGTAGGPPSAVVGFHIRTGRQVANFPTVGENLAHEHANSGLALDRAGRLYVLNTQLGIYRLSANGRQEP